MNASIVNIVEGDVIGGASTVLRKRLLVITGLDVRANNPVHNKFLFNSPARKVYGKKRRKCKKKCKPCYVCANWGHSGNFCPRVTCSVCSKKESKNSVEEDHTYIFCLKCGSTGHTMFSCTNDYDPEDLKGIQCYICMEFGHLCCAKNSTEGPSEASCYNCGQSCHHGFECTKMNVVAKNLKPASKCSKCKKTVHSPETLILDNISTSAETTLLGKDAMLNKFVKAREMDDKSSLAETTMAGVDVVPSNFLKGSRLTQTGDLDNKLTSTETTILEKDAVPDKSIKGTPRKAQIVELDDKLTSEVTTLSGKDAVLNKLVKKKSPKTQAGEKVSKSTSAETSTVTKDAVSDKSIKGKSLRTRRRERRQRKPVMPAFNVVQSLPTMSMIEYATPRYGQYYGNPGSNVWLSPPTAAARNCFVNSPAFNQFSYGRPGLNAWVPPPSAAAAAAAARNYLEISPAVNQSSYQTGSHFSPYGTNCREATHVPPNPFRPRSLLPHEIFHQGTQIPGPSQNRVQLPHQNFIHQIRTHDPRSSFDSWTGISQQPDGPSQNGVQLPHQNFIHQIRTHDPRSSFDSRTGISQQPDGPSQNRVQLPHQNFIHQIRTHDPRSSFDSRTGISQQPEVPHHVSNPWISASIPQHQLSSHRSWMAPPGWNPYS